MSIVKRCSDDGQVFDVNSSECEVCYGPLRYWCTECGDWLSDKHCVACDQSAAIAARNVVQSSETYPVPYEPPAGVETSAKSKRWSAKTFIVLGVTALLIVVTFTGLLLNVRETQVDASREIPLGGKVNKRIDVEIPVPPTRVIEETPIQVSKLAAYEAKLKAEREAEEVANAKREAEELARLIDAQDAEQSAREAAAALQRKEALKKAQEAARSPAVIELRVWNETYGITEETSEIMAERLWTIEPGDGSLKTVLGRVVWSKDRFTKIRSVKRPHEEFIIEFGKMAEDDREALRILVESINPALSE